MTANSHSFLGEDGEEIGIVSPSLGEEFSDIMEVEIRHQKPSSFREKSSRFLREITVEPAIFGSMFVIIMYSTLQKEYVHKKLSMDYNLTTDGREESCNHSTANKSDPQYILEQRVQSETSEWTLYLYVADFSMAALSSVLLGAWSDKVGRKIPLLISSFGIFILILIYVLVVNLNLPLPVLLGGHFLCGLLGDMGTVMGCSFSHIADITTPDRRTFRMAVIETSSGFGGLVASLTGGFWVQAQGFKQPLWFLLAITAFNIIYIGIRIKSTHEGSILSNIKFLFTKEPFIHMYRVVKKQDDNSKRHISIILYVVCFFIAVTVLAGVRDVLVIYELGLPFCWDFILVGISLAVSNISYFISIILIKTFPKVSAEFWLVMVGALSNMISCVVFAFSTTTWMIFLGLTLQLCYNLPGPIIRSQTSRVVTLTEVGSVFGLLSFAYNLGNLTASFIFNWAFAATIKSLLPGAVFLIGTVMFAIFIPLYWWAYKLAHNLQYRKISEDTEEEIN